VPPSLIEEALKVLAQLVWDCYFVISGIVDDRNVPLSSMLALNVRLFTVDAWYDCFDGTKV